LLDTVPAEGAVVAAPIAVDVVRVVTGFVQAGLREAIAATRELTGRRAFVRVVFVPVVAPLDILLDSIPTEGAVVAAGIAVDVVLVVTGLISIRLGEAVTALGSFADLRALVRVVFVPVVALLVRLLKAIATFGRRACFRAVIFVVGVTVVTFFPGLDDAVATLGSSALARTRVVFVLVGVVTDLVALSMTIATIGRFASVGAVIGDVVQVPVVTLFAFLGVAVAANREFA
jgi:hypothetical protein